MAHARVAPAVDPSATEEPSETGSTRQQPHDDRGASAVEYAILVAAIAAVVTVVVIALGSATVDLFDIQWP